MSIENLYSRNTGNRLSCNAIKRLTQEHIQQQFDDPNLALTIMLETGDIGRFEQVGNFTSYCRCVGSEYLSNGKKKGQGNTKNGNKYLAWAFVEAANFAIRFNEQAKRFYQRKAAKGNRIVAIKAVAHKLARASFYAEVSQFLCS